MEERFIENIKSSFEKYKSQASKFPNRIYIDISTYNKLNDEQAIKLYNVVKEYNVGTKIIVLDNEKSRAYRLKENGKLVLI